MSDEDRDVIQSLHSQLSEDLRNSVNFEYVGYRSVLWAMMSTREA